MNELQDTADGIIANLMLVIENMRQAALIQDKVKMEEVLDFAYASYNHWQEEIRKQESEKE